MRTVKFYLALDSTEQGLIMRTLNNERNRLLNEGRYPDAVNELLIKVGTAPQKKIKVVEKGSNDTR